MNETIIKITKRIIERSKTSRKVYVQQMEQAELKGRTRTELSCGNLAHAFAACNDSEKDDLTGEIVPNLAIISAYNDMLSAHKPYETYPNQLRAAARKNGAVAQFAGGVPAMCDGVTQGQDGMDLSLLSRDVIAMSTAIALSHNMFDGTICLGICDKIVPGQLIGALKFGHLPTIFIPGGPMETGISNEEKAKIRQDYAQGLISRKDLLKGESAAYHSAGTCTFYGTANSNQMLMEIMGLHLPSSSFVNPETPLRHALTDEAVKQLVTNIKEESKVPLYKIISEKTIVNGIIGLLATGGSTNHTMHIVAIAKAAGIIVDWEDFSELSKIIPSITRVYPNGKADINHFHAAGGMSYVFRTLLDNDLLHKDVMTVVGKGLGQYIKEWYLEDEKLLTREGPKESLDKEVISSANNPFDPQGGIKLVKGNLGKAVAKVSAVAKDHMIIEAPAMVFDDQNDLLTAFKEKKLNKDFIAVVRFQGPKAKGMPELHKLTPTLSILQHNGFKVALVTDGRMSGASGKVPSAIHVSPEAMDGGLLPLLRDGDLLKLDCEKGELSCLNEKEVTKREPVPNPPKEVGTGRELFDNVRALISSSETGATIF
ncbi:phosphogluconate dehydratase [Flavobacteriales bacterium]|nr:phosphogluconate dehydratase [Flavobacteriales bacterium]